MAHLVARMTGLVTAWALVVACSPGAVDPGAEGASANSDSRSRAWPGNSAVVVGERPCVWWDRPTPRDLSPTGIELLVAPGSDTRKRRSNLAVEGMAVDGTGAVWIHSPWRLFRIDPDTGDASTWDIGDDLAFGTVSSIRPSVSAGVWLLYEDRVALFDGLRFVRELIVPGAYRLDKPIRSFVEFGSEAWVASPAGVARYDSGLWSMVGDDRLRSAASLTIGPPGQVWASGRLGVVNGTPRGVVRFDGQTWQQVGGPVPMVPQEKSSPTWERTSSTSLATASIGPPAPSGRPSGGTTPAGEPSGPLRSPRTDTCGFSARGEWPGGRRPPGGRPSALRLPGGMT